MLVLSFFSWWYGRGWQGVAQNIGPRLKGIAAIFSVSQLIKTLFAPWRRIITYPGSTLGERFRAWGDNIFSRAIGFVVRSIVLFTAFIAIIVIGLASIVEVAIWPLLPFAVPVLIIVGVT